MNSRVKECFKRRAYDEVNLMRNILDNKDRALTYDALFSSANKAAKFNYALITTADSYESLDQRLAASDIVPLPDGDKREQDVLKFFEYQSIDVIKFATFFWAWLYGKTGRRNVLRLLGSPGTGKSTLASIIARPFICEYFTMPNLRGEFKWEGMLNKELIVWEEPLIVADTAQDCKRIMAGDNITVPAKYKGRQTLIRTPILMTTNHQNIMTGTQRIEDERALQERVKDFAVGRKWDITQGLLTSEGFYSVMFKARPK